MHTPSAPVVDIIMVVFPGFLLLDAAGPLQVFSMADQEAAQSARAPRYRLRTVSVHGGLVRSACGLAVQCEPLPRPARLRGATLLVAGGEGTEGAMRDPRLMPWLRAAARHVARCCSICTGAFLLAQAGLLDGRRAVTHWQDAALFKQLFPQVALLDDAIYVRDQQVYTSAGVTAGIDLSLSLVEADHDRALSLRIAKRLVLPLRRGGGQRQFSAALLTQAHDDSGLAARLTHWLTPRLHLAISVADMAHALALSERSLHRHLMAQAGLSPARLLTRMRVERACTLMESGNTTLKRLVQQTGFGSAYNLRRAFQAQLGVSPSDYLSRFSAMQAAKTPTPKK